MSPEAPLKEKMKEKPVINLPASDLPIKPLTVHDVEKALKKKISRIYKEFRGGFKFIKNQTKSVTFFGSSRFKEGNAHYAIARRIGERLAKLGYTVVTGGGPGIMEAGNRGAYEAGGVSLGLNIELSTVQAVNPYLTKNFNFFYFFTRKVMLTFSAEAYLFFPGGFGTLDEFFELLTLVQTNKIEKVPIIAVGRDYWSKLHDFIQDEMYEKHAAIDKSDMNLYTITDDEDEIVNIIKNVPVRTGARDIE